MGSQGKRKQQRRVRHKTRFSHRPNFRHLSARLGQHMMETMEWILGIARVSHAGPAPSPLQAINWRMKRSTGESVKMSCLSKRGPEPGRNKQTKSFVLVHCCSQLKTCTCGGCNSTRARRGTRKTTSRWLLLCWGRAQPRKWSGSGD